MPLQEGWHLLSRDILVVFYYLCASEIWPDKRGGLWWELTLSEGDYCIWSVTPFYMVISLRLVLLVEETRVICIGMTYQPSISYTSQHVVDRCVNLRLCGIKNITELFHHISCLEMLTKWDLSVHLGSPDKHFNIYFCDFFVIQDTPYFSSCCYHIIIDAYKNKNIWSFYSYHSNLTKQ